MKTLQEKYNAVLEGKYPKSQFVRSAKMEVPRFISPYNGFDDTVQILKNKGMLVEQEQVVPEYDKPGPGVSLEALERGIDYELEEMGINTATESPSEEDYEKAKAKVEKNLEKDPNHYLHILSGDGKKVDKHDREVEVDQKKLFKGAYNPAGGKAEGNTDTFNAMKKADLNEATKKKFAKLLKEGAVEDLAKKLGIPVEKLQASIDKIKKAEMVATAAAAKAAKPTYSETVDEQSKETKFDPRDIKSVSFPNGTEVAVGEPVPDDEGIVISIEKGQNGYEILFKDGSEAGGYYVDLNGEEIDEDDFIEENKSELNEEMAPTGIGISGDQLDDLNKLGAIAGVEVTVRDKDGSNIRKVDYTLTNTSFEKNPDDIDIPQESIKEAVKKVIKHVLNENHQSLDLEVARRIEGLLDQALKAKFLDAGKDLIKDLTKEDQFNRNDVVSHLANELNLHVPIRDLFKEEALNEGRGDLDMIVRIIDDRADESGFEPREEAAEVIAAIADHYKLNLKMIQNYLDSDDPVNPVAEGEDINEKENK